jgi:hypothetical protein
MPARAIVTVCNDISRGRSPAPPPVVLPIGKLSAEFIGQFVLARHWAAVYDGCYLAMTTPKESGLFLA